MPRPLRHSREGTIYHVIMRGNNRRALFHSTGEYYRFCQLMEEGINHFGHSLIAFCLMTNHVHLAVQVGEAPLSKIYHDLSFRYAQFYHHAHDSCGHVFQGRFKSIPVKNSAHLATLIRYIHLNPVKAGIVELPQQYRWSSHKAYLGEEEIPWLSPKTGLECFDSNASVFKKYVLSAIDKDEKFNIKSGKLSIELEGLVNVVCDHYGLVPDALGSTGRTGQSGHVRSVIALLAKEVHGVSLDELAAYFNRHPDAVCKYRTRLQTKLHSSPKIQAEIDTIYSVLLEC
jgi:REP-associated tyrosine transposase